MSNTKWVKQRILSEYEKYKDSNVDWAEMASRKIMYTLKHKHEAFFSECMEEVNELLGEDPVDETYYDGASYGIAKMHYKVMNWLEDEN